jgi:prephenate dehydrogenase
MADSASSDASSPPEFARISILGVGLIGGSIGLGLSDQRRRGRVRVTGYGHRPATLAAATELGVLDETATDPAAAVVDAELVIL